jgi:radical SAM superfamily enzyme YgiQ (UPF0313 family)
MRNITRIVLVQPPRHDEDRSIPLSLLSLASYLERRGFKPAIFDAHLIFSKTRYSPDYFRKIAERIMKARPEVLGFTSMCQTLPAALLIVDECKKIFPSLLVIFGGPECFFDDAILLKTFKQINIVIRGEGERTLTEILEVIRRKGDLSDIAGISYRKNNRIIRNPDRPHIENLDNLPLLNFSLLPHLDKYEIGQVEVGRGCPFKCAFCASCRMWKRTVRVKSPKRLMKELKVVFPLFKNSENPCITLIHDNLLTSPKWIEEFFSLLEDENILWACYSRLEALNDGVIEKLIRSGCRGVFIGVESASPRVLRGMRKNLDLTTLPHVLRTLDQKGILTILSFILGFPGEGIKDINKTLHLALKSKMIGSLVNVRIHLLTILKGSEIYVRASKAAKGSRFLTEDIAPTLFLFPAEASLVKKYPNIFPSFYLFKKHSIKGKTLYKTCLLFNFLIGYFPQTTAKLLEHFKVTPFRLGQKIISFFEENELSWKLYCNEKKFLNYYLRFFKDFVKQIPSSSLQKIFVRENIF